MSKDINDLRERLFATLDGLSDKENPMPIERAKAIADVARVIVDSAKAETQLLQATGAKGAATAFIPAPPPPAPTQRRLPSPTPGGCTNCGGQLVPETNGGGQLIDRCRDCGRITTPSANGDGSSNRVVARGPAKA